MLYDPKWEKQTKADPHSLASLIAWLEQQPANGAYCFLDNGGCLMHQYYAAHGFKNFWVGGWTVRHANGEGRELFRLTEEFKGIASDGQHTFGAALKRARRAAKSEAQ